MYLICNVFKESVQSEYEVVISIKKKEHYDKGSEEIGTYLNHGAFV